LAQTIRETFKSSAWAKPILDLYFSRISQMPQSFQNQTNSFASAPSVHVSKTEFPIKKLSHTRISMNGLQSDPDDKYFLKKIIKT
jgi:hypothetical protein